MEFRLWIGLWTALFLTILVAFNLSFLVKYITRFTEVILFKLTKKKFFFSKYTNYLFEIGLFRDSSCNHIYNRRYKEYSSIEKAEQDGSKASIKPYSK